MNSLNEAAQQVIIDWRHAGIEIDFQHATIVVHDRVTKLEPKVMDLLQLLLAQPNQLVSKDDITDALWRDRCVNEEALTKLVSKLRKAFDDDSKQPRFIKTIPKKGYLLIHEPAPTDKPQPGLASGRWPWLVAGALLVVLGLLIYGQPQPPAAENSLTSDLQHIFAQAENHYYQYSRIENESAMRLYEKIIAANSHHAPSHSGLANALVQKALRWPNAIDEVGIQHSCLIDAIEAGRLDGADIKKQLKRAEGLAMRAVQLSPNDAKAHRSLGLVYAAQQQLGKAEQQYRKALSIDPREWGALINLSEIQGANGEPEAALSSLELAFAAMAEDYQQQAVIVRPWHADLGVVIAEQNIALNRHSDAEVWYRKVLSFEPFHRDASLGLIHVLQQLGDPDAAANICFDLKQKVDPQIDC